MPVGSVSLRPLNDYKKTEKNSSAQNFGQRPEKKNHKAAYIAGSVGLMTVLGIVLYAFKGRIAKTDAVKKAVKLGEDVLEKVKNNTQTTAENVMKTAQNTIKKTTDNVIKKTNEVVEKTKDFSKQIKENIDNGYKKAVDGGSDIVENIRKKFSKNANKTSEFSQKEAEILEKYRKSGANQKGVFDVFKAHGMTETEEKYIKETMDLLKEKLAKNNSKPVSMRAIINSSMKKENASEMIADLLKTVQNYRKKWEL